MQQMLHLEAASQVEARAADLRRRVRDRDWFVSAVGVVAFVDLASSCPSRKS